MTNFSSRALLASGVALVCLTSTVAFAATREDALAMTSVYRIGYPVEVAIEAGKGLGEKAVAENATATKHYAMGRLAWELAYVMPDNRTVYAGDDGTNRGMIRFVADTANDLSAGELFTAKLTQTSEIGGKNGEFTIEWISMGHATDAEIDAFIAKGLKFSDLFDTVDVSNDACADGFTPVEIESGAECLKLKTSNDLGMSAEDIAKAASRVETLRYAAIRGGTTEFRKFEGITFDAKRNKLYIAISDVGKAMAGAPKLAGVADAVNVKSNKCGAVYQLSVDANMTTTDMQILVAGGSYNKSAAVDSCDINKISNPDNVVMGPTADILFIGEDTDNHRTDVVWAYDLNTSELTRVFTTPYGSETTSPMYYKNINDTFDLMMTVVQHPFGESDEDLALDPSDKRAYIGYVTIPAKIQATDAVSFKPLPFASTDAAKRQAKFTDAMTVNGTELALDGYRTLLRSGDKFGDITWGQLVDMNGAPLVNYSASDMGNGVSASPDHSTLFKTEKGELFSITQFEESAGAMYISSLDIDHVSGALTVTGTKPVNLAPTFGGWTFCAGIPTAWGTHLGGEEYPTDARAFETNGQVDKYFDRYLEYFGFDPKS